LKIYTCSQAMLGIAERIIHSPRSSPCFWSAASSSLTALREFIVYARQAGSDLFTDLERVQSWRDFLEQATPACGALGNIGIDSFGEVFPLSESLLGHPAPRREAGERVARPITPGSPSGSGYRNDADTADNLIPSTVYQRATAVRRLTPRECERLQGFPDDYTLVPYRNKPASDGPRYKALGNSMAVPVMAWIGQRIAMLESLNERAAA
jgi:DNA (cytosine-5)-methyltransferase 1